MAESPRRPLGWMHSLACLLGLWLAIGTLYRQTLGAMMQQWSSSDTYAHGFVVPLISLWLVWRIRHQLKSLSPRPAPLAWLLLGAAATLWFAGDLVAVNVVTQLALVLLFIFTVPAVLGWSVARGAAFPLGFLLFAVPIGDFMLPQLMEWTADFTVVALRASGIPVYREGLQFIIPSGAWSVVEACSGIRYLIASLTVGCLFAYLSYRGMAKRLAFVGVSLVVPLVANWMRAYLIVMIGHLSGNELATGVDHLIYGWVFFGIVIMAMLFLGARWADAPEPQGAVASADAGSLMPASGGADWPALAGAACAVLGVLLAPHLLARVMEGRNLTDPVLLVAPAAQSPWQAGGAAPVDWSPAFRNPSAAQAWGYAGPQEAQVGVHLSYYRQQGYDRKLVSSENVLVTSSNQQWAKVVSGSAESRLSGQSLTVSETLLREQQGGLAADSRRVLAWRFYWVNGSFTASDVQAKLQGALSRLSGRGDDGAIVVVYTPLPRGMLEADARRQGQATLQAFVEAHGASLASALQSVRDRR